MKRETEALFENARGLSQLSRWALFASVTLEDNRRRDFLFFVMAALAMSVMVAAQIFFDRNIYREG